MHRVKALWGVEGMRFAWVPMTMAKAWTVGTVLFSVVVWASQHLELLFTLDKAVN